MKKDRIISVRVSQKEFIDLSERASNYGLTISRFLRDLAMNYPLTCITDQKVAHEMLLIAGDIGRLGGLFKLWLSNNSDNMAAFSKNRSYKDIDEVLDKILELQEILKNKAMVIIEYDSQEN